MNNDNKAPLSGIIVIDMTAHAAGPSCARWLGYWGADVIKVEPFEGDFVRVFGPTMGMPATEEENPLMEINLGNKRSVVVDLKSSKGQEIIHKLLAKADVFATTYRLPALRKLKLTYEDLSPKYPKLVYGILTGFGEKGPDAEKAGFDVVAYWARTGAMRDLVDAKSYPMSAPAAFGDHPTGTALAAGICAALVKQKLTGRGDKVSISLLGNGLWNAAWMITGAQKCYDFKWPKDRYNPYSPLMGTYKCKDGEWLLISILQHERYWPALCRGIGREDLIPDERFSTLMAAKKHLGELVTLLEDVFATKTRSEWLAILREADIACDNLQHFKDVENDEMAWANGYIYEHTYTNKNKSILLRPPVQFAEMGIPEDKRAPLLGEHTKEVLTEVGYSSTEIADLENNRVIKCR